MIRFLSLHVVTTKLFTLFAIQFIHIFKLSRKAEGLDPVKS